MDFRRLRRKHLDRRVYEVKEVRDKHHEIIRRLVIGQNNIEIAEALGCTPQNVSDVRNSPLVKAQLGILHTARNINAADIRKDIMELGPAAVQAYREGLQHGQPINIRVKTAGEVFDRGLAPKITKSMVEEQPDHYTEEDIIKLKEVYFERTKTIEKGVIREIKHEANS